MTVTKQQKQGQPFIPDSFEPPKRVSTSHFSFTVLDEQIATADYELVMANQPRLQGIFGPSSNWPKASMTFEENIASLATHREEFMSRAAFAYAVYTRDSERYIGCVYIDPPQSSDFDCDVYLWIGSEDIALDDLLYQTITHWLKTAWPFSKLAFPGRNAAFYTE